MSEDAHDRAPRVAEPVQVYLRPDEQDRLTRLTRHLDASKSDVLRRGLEALEREVTDPAGHPALRVVGIGASGMDEPGAGGPDPDPARDHDEVLARTEARSWRRASRQPERGPPDAEEDHGA